MDGVCDKYCKGCVYFSQVNGTIHYCAFYLDTGIRRPCPAGKGCTVKTRKKVRSMKQVIDDQTTSYLARLERLSKEDKTQLGQEMTECEKAGYGVHYGAWKATQPVKEIVKVEDKSLKVCPWCGEKFVPRAKNSKYCCVDHQTYAYLKRKRDRLRKAAEEL